MSSKPKRSIFRRGLVRLLWLLAGRRRSTGPLDPSRLRRVLLLRYDRIGDAVITTPLLDALHRLAPGIRIDVLGTGANAVVFRHDHRVAETIVWPRSLMARLGVILRCRRQRYDATFQLIFGRTTLPAILASLVTPHGLTVGKHGNDPLDLTNIGVMLCSEHFTERTYEILFAAAGLPMPEQAIPYSLAVSEEDNRTAARAVQEAGLTPGRFIVLNISSGSPERELTVEQNTALITATASQGLPFVVTGAPDARAAGEAIAAASGAHLMWFASLTATAALIRSARMIITPDTSIVHIASAMGTPTVAFYPANSHPAGWGPRGVPHRIVVAPGTHSTSLDVPALAAAAGELLGQVNGRQ